MNDHIIQTTIEILGRIYPIRCQESELASLQEAAVFLNEKMTEVKDSGKAINLERIAIISALNIAHQYLQMSQQKVSHINTIHQRLSLLQNKLEEALQPELAYNAE